MKKTLFLTLITTFFAVSITSISAQTNWVKLFDGKTLAGWKQATGTANYKVENEAIVGITVPSSPNSFLITEKQYGDFVLELEVKIEDTTSNSGIQFRSQFDANGNNGKGKVFGYQYELDPSARQWTAGVYDEARRGWLYPLSLNPVAQNAFKLNEFNKVKIECVGSTIRTWINGQAAAIVIDTVDKKGIIALQVHAISKADLAGKKIYWKNIRIKSATQSTLDAPKSIYVVNRIPNQLSVFEKTNGYKLLFDGVSSRGWKSAFNDSFPSKGWFIKDGVIGVEEHGGAESKYGGDIVTLEQFSAFDLSFDFKITKGANSGVKYFVTLKEKNSGSAIGPEFQVLDDSTHPDAKLGNNGNRTLGSLYDLITAKKEKRFINQPGEWNTGRIVVYRNNHVEHYLNGVKVVEYERGSKAFKDLVAISKFKVWPNFGEAKEGRILLQDHGNAVNFRSIKIKTL
ncbi:MAG: DUF1080 domain-containing protein [Pedobacter sp.]|nr:DUF1080 domain-containing protein [Chitinophagaceae bacterium]